MGRDEDKVLEMIMRDKARGDEIDDELKYDPATRTLRHVPRFHDPDGLTNMTPEDATLWSRSAGGQRRIVISAELVRADDEGLNDVMFHSWDGGDVYSLLGDGYTGGSVPGTLYILNGHENIPALALGKAEDKVRIIIRRPAMNSGGLASLSSIGVTGYVLRETMWEEVLVETVPVGNEIFSRIGGLFETAVLAKKRVFVIGLGSGGSHATLELAKSGVTRFDLMDYQRLEVGNVVRHVAGLPHVGRYKTKVMAQLIKEKNPYAEVQTWEEKVSWENIEKVRPIVRKSDIIVCGTDNRRSRRVLNKLCVQENKPIVFAGAFRRAYGGQIIFVRPRVSLCYECFCIILPEQAGDEEISSLEQAAGIAYSDRPVAIEPGLSTDIAPISLMAVKLVIQALLKGTDTTLRSLDDDLVAPWYLWLNRREAGTQYEKLEPLGFHLGGLHVLRWYGIKVDRHPGCPVCGDSEGEMVKQ